MLELLTYRLLLEFRALHLNVGPCPPEILRRGGFSYQFGVVTSITMTKGSNEHKNRSDISIGVIQFPPYAVAVITCRFIRISLVVGDWRESFSALLGTALHQERMVALNSKVSHFTTATTNSDGLYVCPEEIK